jgi:hypothetical protein
VAPGGAALSIVTLRFVEELCPYTIVTEDGRATWSQLGIVAETGKGEVLKSKVIVEADDIVG